MKEVLCRMWVNNYKQKEKISQRHTKSSVFPTWRHVIKLFFLHNIKAIFALRALLIVGHHIPHFYQNTLTQIDLKVRCRQTSFDSLTPTCLQAWKLAFTGRKVGIFCRELSGADWCSFPVATMSWHEFKATASTVFEATIQGYTAGDLTVFGVKL